MSRSKSNSFQSMLRQICEQVESVKLICNESIALIIHSRKSQLIDFYIGDFYKTPDKVEGDLLEIYDAS